MSEHEFVTNRATGATATYRVRPRQPVEVTVSHPQCPRILVEGQTWWVEMDADNGDTIRVESAVVQTLIAGAWEPDRCEIAVCDNYADGRWCAEHASSRRP